MSVLDNFLSAALPGMKFLTDDQVKRESGGEQFNKQGQPLIGRHRDGSMPAPSQRAYGAAQIQIGTARETAAAHGIPFDEKRLLNDRAYNLQLGDLHMQDLTKRYGGDTVKAQAAYHSGTGTVDRAIQKHGNNWRQGLGPEGKAYIGAGGGGSMAGNNQPINISIPDILTSDGRTEGSAASTSQVYNPNQAGGQIAQDFQATRDAAVKSKGVLDDAIQSLQGTYEMRKDLLSARNERIDGVLQEAAARTEEAMKRTQPLFQQKRALEVHRERLRNMNPLEKAVRGLFDRNYDDQHINAVEKDIDSELATTSAEYKTILDMQSGLMSIVDKSFQGQNALLDLEEQHIGQGMELAGKSIAAESSLWEIDQRGLSADAQLRQMQISLREDVLDQMTPGQIATNLELARKSPDGIITVNGATLTEGVLHERERRYGQQDLQLQQLQASVQVQNQQLMEHNEDRLISTLTTGQIRQAINNGGVFNGQQLPLAKLNEGLQRSMQGDATFAEGTGIQGSAEIYFSVGKGINQSTQVAGMRALQLTGVAPEALLNVVNSQSAEVAKMNREIARERNAGRQEQADMLAQRYLPRIQQMQKAREAAIDETVNRWAGNDKSLVPLGRAFMLGQPLNGGDAARGLISLVRSGKNFGSGVSGEAQAAIAAARAVIKEADSAAMGAGMTPAQMFGKAPNQKEKEAELVRNVSSAVDRAYRQNQYNAIISNAPAVAKAIGHIGQNLDPMVLQSAQRYGDGEGMTRQARAMGINAQQLQTMLSQGPDGALFQQWSKGHQGVTFNQIAGDASNMQQMATLQYLDMNHPKIKGYAAGQVYANLQADSRFIQRSAQQMQRAQQQGFGDFTIGSMAGDSTAPLTQQGRGAMMAYQAYVEGVGKNRAATVNAFGTDPWMRTNTILGAIPGIYPQERAALMAALKQTARMPTQQGPIVSTDIAHDQQFSRIRETINSTKFEDPKIEAIRKRAAQHFEDYSKITAEALEAAATYSPED